jgi:uncharacterized protein
MDITPVIPKGKQIITGYGNGRIMINREPHEGALIVFPDRVISWNVFSMEALVPESFAFLDEMTETVELLLLGTGKSSIPVSPSVRALCKARGVNLEVMDTGAACRTYSILLAEGRALAAALLPV